MSRTGIFLILTCTLIITGSCQSNSSFPEGTEKIFEETIQNGKVSNEGYNRCLRFVHGWLELADSATGLIPRNINDKESQDIWNAKDCAADNYPFMVLITALCMGRKPDI